MSEIKKASKDVFIYTLVNIVPIIMGFISIPIYTRIFNPEQYGQLAIVQMTVNYTAVSMLTWVNSSFIRFYEAYKKKKKEKEMVNNYLFLLFGSSSLAILVYAIFLLLASYFGWFEETLFELFTVGSLLLFFTGTINFIFTYFRAKRESVNFAVVTVANSILTLAFGLVFALLLSFGVKGIVFGSAIVSALISIIIISLIIKKYGLNKNFFQSKIAKEALFYGAPIIFSNLAAWILRFSDRYIIEFTRGTTEVGLYAVSYSISEKSIVLFVNAIAFAVTPILIYSWEHKGVKVTESLLRKFSRYQIMLLLPATVGLFILAPTIINFFVGEAFRGGVLATQIVAIGIFFYGLYGLTNIGLYLEKKTLKIALTMFFIGLINIGINIILIPQYGFLVAAFSTAFSYFLLWFVSYFQTRKVLRWGISYLNLFKILIATFVMALFLLYVRSYFDTVTGLLIVVLISMVIFFGALWILGEIKEESRYVFGKIKDRLYGKQ